MVEVLTSLHDIPDTLTVKRNASTHSTVFSADAVQSKVMGYGDNIVPKPSEDPYRDPEVKEETFGFDSAAPSKADDAPPPKPALPAVCMVCICHVLWYLSS